MGTRVISGCRGRRGNAQRPAQPCTLSRRGDGLSVGLVRSVAAYKYAFSVGLGRTGLTVLDVALLVEVDPPLENVRIRLVSDGHEETGARNDVLFSGLVVLDACAFDAVLTNDLDGLRVPQHFDVFHAQHAVLHGA